MSDPFAAAQVAAGRPDPFTAASEVSDPFAVSSDFRGDFTPAPGMEVLLGRLVVMIPRAFDPEAKDPNDPEGVKKRELYTVDLTVLNGGRMEYFYTVRADPERGTEEEVKTWVIENVTPESPFSVQGYWVPQFGIVGRLKTAHANKQPYLGTVALAATAADRRNGQTASQAAAAFHDWVARGRQGKRPRYSWTLADPTPAERATAVAWWGRVRESIAPIV